MEIHCLDPNPKQNYFGFESDSDPEIYRIRFRIRFGSRIISDPNSDRFRIQIETDLKRILYRIGFGFTSLFLSVGGRNGRNLKFFSLVFVCVVSGSVVDTNLWLSAFMTQVRRKDTTAHKDVLYNGLLL